MSTQNVPTRRVWTVIDQTAQAIVAWLTFLLVCGGYEWSSGAFTKDPFQTYTFVLFQLPFHALVVYASLCMMTIGYHLVVLGKCSMLNLNCLDQRTALPPQPSSDNRSN